MKIGIVVVLVALLLGGFAHADDNVPVVAILRYGGAAGETTWSEFGVLEMLQAEGYIAAEDRDSLNARFDLEGEHITIIWGDAGWDLATANLMVSDSLGREADVLVTLTTPVTRAAVNATMDMDEPPAVLFASVFNAVEAGIIEAACDKPAHVTGSVVEAPYARSLELLQSQNANLGSVGVIHSLTEISGMVGAEEINALGEAMGLTIETAAVSNLADFPAAASSLVGKGVDAILAPVDAVTAQALPVISQIAYEEGIPVLYPILGSVYHGTTFGVGFYDHYDQGLNLGRLLTAQLDGSLDAASAAVQTYTGEAHSVSLDAAEQQGLMIAPEIIDGAAIVLQDGEDSQSDAFKAAYVTRSQDDLRSQAAKDEAAAFIESLRCEG